MKKTVAATDARRRLGELLEGVYCRGDEVIIERAGKPMAVVIPADRYEQLELARVRLFAMVDDVWARNASISPDELESDVATAVAEARTGRPAPPA